MLRRDHSSPQPRFLSSNFRTTGVDDLPQYDDDDLEKKYRRAQELAKIKDAITLPKVGSNPHKTSGLYNPMKLEMSNAFGIQSQSKHVAYSTPANSRKDYAKISAYGVRVPSEEADVLGDQPRKRRQTDHDTLDIFAKRPRKEGYEDSASVGQHNKHESIRLENLVTLNPPRMKSGYSSQDSYKSTWLSHGERAASRTFTNKERRSTQKLEVADLDDNAKETASSEDMLLTQYLNKSPTKEPLRKTNIATHTPESSITMKDINQDYHLAPQEANRDGLLQTWLFKTRPGACRPIEEPEKQTRNALHGLMDISDTGYVTRTPEVSDSLLHKSANDLAFESNRDPKIAARNFPFHIEHMDQSASSPPRVNTPLKHSDEPEGLKPSRSQRRDLVTSPEAQAVRSNEASPAQGDPTMRVVEIIDATPSPRQRSTSCDLSDVIRSKKTKSTPAIFDSVLEQDNKIVPVSRQQLDNNVPCDQNKEAFEYEGQPKLVAHERNVSNKNHSAANSKSAQSHEMVSNLEDLAEPANAGLGPSILGPARKKTDLSLAKNTSTLLQETILQVNTERTYTHNADEAAIDSQRTIAGKSRDPLPRSNAKARRELETFKAKATSIFGPTSNVTSATKHSRLIDANPKLRRDGSIRRKPRPKLQENCHSLSDSDETSDASSQARKSTQLPIQPLTHKRMKGGFDQILRDLKHEYPHLTWEQMVGKWRERTGKTVKPGTLSRRWQDARESSNRTRKTSGGNSVKAKESTLKKMKELISSGSDEASEIDDDSSTCTDSSEDDENDHDHWRDSHSRPSTGGKTINAKFFEVIYGGLDQETIALIHEDNKIAEPLQVSPNPDPISDEDTCHYAYFVQKKLVSATSGEEDIDKVPWTICGKEYENLWTANFKATKIFNSLHEYSWKAFKYEEVDELAQWFGYNHYVTVLVQVQRRMRTFHDSIVPKSAKGFMRSRTGYMVKYKLSPSQHGQTEFSTQKESSPFEFAANGQEEESNAADACWSDGSLDNDTLFVDTLGTGEPVTSVAGSESLGKPKDTSINCEESNGEKTASAVLTGPSKEMSSINSTARTGQTQSSQIHEKPPSSNEQTTEERRATGEKRPARYPQSVSSQYCIPLPKRPREGVTQSPSNTFYSDLGQANQEASILLEQLRRKHFGHRSSKRRDLVNEEERVSRELLDELELEQKKYYAALEGIGKDMEGETGELGIKLEVWVEESKWVGPRN